MDRRNAIELAAKQRGLLHDGTNLVPMDSLMIVDLIVDLEERLSIEIPMQRVQHVHFESIDSIEKLLDEVAGA
jgi:acyl carrier protein